MKVVEMVVIFLSVLAHHDKIRIIKLDFKRSGETISRVVNKVLTSLMRLTPDLLKEPESVAAISNDDRWKWFKVYLSKLFLQIDILG